MRVGLKEIKCHGEVASVASETVDSERLRLQELIKRLGYKPCDIFNANKSGSFYA